MVEYRNLLDLPFSEIHRCFLEAFADYFVDASGVTEKMLFNRTIKNGMEAELSVGAFVNDKLVGFTLTGVDDFKGQKTAFDIATGIIKDYRGQGIAKAMFAFLLEPLKNNNIKSFYLEVIQENEPAIRAYTKTGFNKTRELLCYKLERETFKPKKPEINIAIENYDKNNIEESAEFLDWYPSWENSINSIKRIPDKTLSYSAKVNNQNVGWIVCNWTSTWVHSLVVHPDFRKKGIASALLAKVFEELPETEESVKFINVDKSDSGMLEFLEKIKSESLIDQYEMGYDLQ